jgi:hypothetical protein
LNTLGWNIQKLKIVSTVHRVDLLAHMLIVFDSKSSLIHYTFDKITFLSQLPICIILLYLIFYFSKFMFKSWLAVHENWVSVGSFLVPGNCKNAGFCTIYSRPPAVRPPLRDPPSDFYTDLSTLHFGVAMPLTLIAQIVVNPTTIWSRPSLDDIWMW